MSHASATPTRTRRNLALFVAAAIMLSTFGPLAASNARAAAAPEPSAPLFGSPVTLHFQGNTEDQGGDPPANCLGLGTADIANCDGPFLRTDAALSSGPAATWLIASPALDGTNGRTIYDPSWIWNLSAPTRLGGNMTVNWWATSAASGGALGGSWNIRLWADGAKVFEKQVSAAPDLPNVPKKLSATMFLPEISANNNIVLHIDPVFVDAQNATRIHYDSQLPCPGATGSEPCDSTVVMPVLAASEPAPTPDGGPAPTGTPDPNAARFHTFLSPAGFANSWGEPSIGANWRTGNVMFYGGFGTDALRIRFDDASSPARDTWTKTPLNLAATTRVLGDPILYTDRDTGRTLVSQLLGGTKQSTTDVTDDDGATYRPTVGAGLNSGVDHQTLGGGPFAPGALPHSYPNAVYYCAQDAADANCALSLDGGITFGPAIPIYNITQCGGIHGHIKVAPDGTAYVPNGSCGGTQGVAVSTDNGLTWTVRNVAGTTASGEDPSLGIASDGTVYMGFVDGDGRPKAAVSRNRGATWTDITEIGASFGIKHAVFPVAVAGDPDRAAVGFIGTPADGNPDDMNTFRGVWHLYVASTYDGGKTWTTVDTTPDDPVQIGSVCRAGTTCGEDRNLLDFNDATVDKDGRVIVGYADGCVAPVCTQANAAQAPPYTMSRSSKGVVARQSGGKRMFARFDPPAGPTAPAAPRVDQVGRTGTSGPVELKWSEPDNGGAPVNGYKVYRRTATGAYGSPLATTAARSYTDSSAASGTTYFYKVTATNSVGEGPAAGEFSPTAIVNTNLCDLPGNLVVEDTSDSGQNTPPDGRVDIKKVFVGEPYFADGSSKVVFTLQTGTSPLPGAAPSSEWLIIWNRRQRAADGSDRMYVAMRTDLSGAATYEYGNFGPALPLDGSIPPTNANSPTRLGAADAGTYDAAKGLITITVSTSKIENLQPGQALGGVNARTFFARPAIGPRSQNVASDISADGLYTLSGNLACRPNVAPVALLAATPRAGALPLAVNFDASGSTDPDAGDSVVEYTFDFGDGSAPVTQNAPAVSHTYTRAGDFFARLTVRDARGLSSTNLAQVVINAVDPSAPVNHALASNGAVASASSTYTTRNYSAAGAIDGGHTSAGWEAGNGWNDNTRGVFPDWLQVDFAGTRTVNEIRVYTLPDGYSTPTEPTTETTATGYGLLDFDVQYWDGSSWVTVPGGEIRGNDRAMRVLSVPGISTAKIRVLVHDARAYFSRILEVEAIGPAGQ